MRTSFTNLSRSLVFVSALFAGTTGIGQTITLGTGTATNSTTTYPAPYGNWYWGARHQILISASELAGEPCLANITSLAFSIANINTSPALQGYSIKLGHTTVTSLSTWITTGLTTVYSVTSYTPTNGLNTHTFQTPFAYDGSSNIVVEICFNNGSFTTNASHYYTTTSNTSVYYYRADASGVCSNTSVTGTSNLRPNMVLGFSSDGFNAGIGALVSPVSACSFGSSETITTTITNSGADTITSLPLHYQINGGTAVSGTWTGSLNPGASTTYSFSTTANLSSLMSATIKVYHSASADTCNSNDTNTTTIGTQLAGDFTVGGSSPDYATPAAAIAAMTSTGICGPVTFHVRQGTYSGQLNLGAVSGASATNTITFVSDTNNTSMPVITHNSGYTWLLNGTSYVTIDGLEINYTLAGTGYCMSLTGLNKRLTIRNCEFNGYTIATTSNAYSLIYQSTSASDYTRQFVCENNTFNNGSIGIYLYGGSTLNTTYNRGPRIVGNTFNNVGGYSFYSGYSDTLLFEDNTINMGSATTNYGYYQFSTNRANIKNNTFNMTGTGTTYTIYLSSGSVFWLDGNYVNLSNAAASTGYGVYSFSSGLSTEFARVSNNMIASPIAGNFKTGFYFSGSYINLWNNSVRVNQNTAGTTYGPLYMSGTGNVVQNNLFQNDGNGYAASFGTAYTHSYNLYKTTGTTLLNPSSTNVLGTGEYNQDPGFTSTTDLHVVGFTNGYNGATSLAGVTVDFDGDTRSSTPDMGADEYDLPENDGGIMALNSPAAPFAAGSQSVSVAFKNHGIENIDTIQIDWTLNGVAQASVQWTGSLAPGQTQSNVSLGTGTFVAGENSIVAWTYDPNNVSDENTANDTMWFDLCTGYSGTYTIGDSSADFQTIQSAMDALACGGLLGAVTLDIDPAAGPYVEQVSINGVNIAGMSSTNSVFVQGHGADLQFNATTAAPHILKLNGAKYFIIDSLDITSLSTLYGFGIQMSNSADFNTITNCNIQLPNSSSTQCGGIVFSNSTSYTGSGDAGDYNNFAKNNIDGGYFGIWSYGSSTTYLTGNVFDDNNIEDYYVYGSYLYYSTACTVSNNYFSRPNATTLTTFYSVYVTTGCASTLVDGNRIHTPNGNSSSTAYSAYGLYHAGSAGSTTPNVFRNNVVYNMDNISSTLYGIYNGSSYASFYHNTVVMDDQLTGLGTVYGIYSISNTGVIIRNNTVETTKNTTSSQYNIYLSGTGATINNNNYYNNTASTTSYIGYYAANFNELSNWQTANSNAYDANSTQVNPYYVDAANGDFTPNNSTMNNIGATGTGVTLDINGNTRGSSPDPGAFEFTPVDNVKVLTVLSPANFGRDNTSTAFGTANSVTIRVQNSGSSTVSNVPVWYSLNGGTPVIDTVSSSITPGSYVDFTFASTVNLSTTGTYDFMAATDFATDSIPSDDTAAFEIRHVANDAVTLPVTEDFEMLASMTLLDNANALEGAEWIDFTRSEYGGRLRTVLSPYTQGTRSIILDDIGSGSPDNYLYWTVNMENYDVSDSVRLDFTQIHFAEDLNAADYLMVRGSDTNTWINLFDLYTNQGTSLATVNFANIDVSTALDNAGQNFSSSFGLRFGQEGFSATTADGRLFDNLHLRAMQNYDADLVQAASEYTMIPASQSGSIDFYARVENVGLETVTDVMVTIETDSMSVSESIDTLVAYGSDLVEYSIYGLTQPDMGTFTATAYSEVSEGDQVTTNDTVTGLSYTVNDSVFARDNNVLFGGIGFTGAGSSMGQMFRINDADTVTQITSYHNGGGAGNTISYQVYSVSGGLPDSLLFESAPVTLSGLAAWHTYNFCNPELVDAGDYFVAVKQNSITNMSIGRSTGGYLDNRTYYGAGSTWTEFGDAAFPQALMLRVVMGHWNDYDGIIAAAPAFCDSSSVMLDARPNYEGYLWSNGATSQTIGATTAGWHYVTVTNGVDCELVDSVWIEADTISASITGTTQASCGVDNGTATALGSNGFGSYTYLWPNGDMSATSDSLSAAIYSVTVTDSIGCSVTADATVSNAGSPTVIVTPTNIVCGGTSTGSIATSVSGGVSPYEYAWSTSSTASSVSALAAGTYTLTVTDAADCQVIQTTTLTQNPVLGITGGSTTNVTCNGLTNGGKAITPTGGISSYTYAWSNGQTGQNLSNVGAGTYTVTLTDAVSCTTTASYTITEPAVLTTMVSTSGNVSCFGGTNGSIASSTSGGTTAYSYLWSNGATGATASGLAAGTYTLTVTDANSCTATLSQTISEPTVLTNAINQVTNVLCNGFATGQITTTQTGGTTPYSYNWTGGGSTSTKSSAMAGNYTLTVTDALGCTATASATITQPTLITGVDSIVTPLCNGDSNASIYLTTSGGVSPYSWLWSNGAASENNENIAAGTYTVSMTDANACTVTDVITVSQPDVLMTTFTGNTNSLCELGANGALDVTTTGGTMPYTWMWADSVTTEDRSGLAYGTYYVMVTDTNGCSYMDSAFVNFTNAAPVVEITGEDTICDGEQSVLTATLGYSTYAWSNGNIFPLNYVSATGTYTVTITAFNTCQNWISFDVYASPAITFSASSENVNCEGGNDGEATTTTAGGTSPFTYTWSDGQTTADASNLVAGTYTVTATDAAGCQMMDTVTIDFNFVNPTVNIGKDTVICFIPEFNQFYSVTVDAGAGFSAYTWSTGETSQTIQTGAPGAYSVLVTDSNGCSAVDTMMVDSVECLGVEDFGIEAALMIYPNPTRDLTTITIESATDAVFDMQVINAQGQLIMSIPSEIKGGSFNTTIDMSSQARGVYTVRLMNGDHTITKRIVVQ